MSGASLNQSQPSVSCSPAASFAPPPPSTAQPFQLAHSPLFPSHQRARASHPANPARQPVPDDRLSFASAWAEYRPADFTAPATARHSPDPADAHDLAADAWAQRRSTHAYTRDGGSGRPLNPFGRTGLAGRGKLYYWGPNHAADCILLRPAQAGGEGEGEGVELLAIQRGDTGEMALVGGMIEKGELPEHCIKREFGEEVLGLPEAEAKGDKGADEAGQAQGTAEQRRVLDAIFAAGNTACVYRGYVDDARNTDNAWLETAAFVYDLPDTVTAEQAQRLFVGGSDASAVRWVKCGAAGEKLPPLYASHTALVKLALQRRQQGKSESVADGQPSKI